MLDVKISSDLTDNPFSEFLTSIQAAYFWTADEWVQLDIFDFWAVDIFSILASVLFVTILQNMLIAFMGYEFDQNFFVFFLCVY